MFIKLNTTYDSGKKMYKASAEAKEYKGQKVEIITDMVFHKVEVAAVGGCMAQVFKKAVELGWRDPPSMGDIDEVMG